MKSQIGVRLPIHEGEEVEFSVLTRMDDICRFLLTRICDETPTGSAETLMTVVSIYIHGATYIECLTNYLLRAAIKNCTRNADPDTDTHFYSAVERYQTEKKVELLSELKKCPLDLRERLTLLKILIGRRNFLIHYKAKPDTHSIESLGWSREAIIDNLKDITSLHAALPDQAWVIELVSCDRKELINSFITLGDWLEESFAEAENHRQKLKPKPHKRTIDGNPAQQSNKNGNQTSGRSTTSRRR